MSSVPPTVEPLPTFQGAQHNGVSLIVCRSPPAPFADCGVWDEAEGPVSADGGYLQPGWAKTWRPEWLACGKWACRGIQVSAQLDWGLSCSTLAYLRTALLPSLLLLLLVVTLEPGAVAPKQASHNACSSW